MGSGAPLPPHGLEVGHPPERLKAGLFVSRMTTCPTSFVAAPKKVAGDDTELTYRVIRITSTLGGCPLPSQELEVHPYLKAERGELFFFFSN